MPLQNTSNYLQQFSNSLVIATNAMNIPNIQKITLILPNYYKFVRSKGQLQRKVAQYSQIINQISALIITEGKTLKNEAAFLSSWPNRTHYSEAY